MDILSEWISLDMHMFYRVYIYIYGNPSKLLDPQKAILREQENTLSRIVPGLHVHLAYAASMLNNINNSSREESFITCQITPNHLG